MGALREYLDCQIVLRSHEKAYNQNQRTYAKYGSLNIPLHILSEIEDIKQKIIDNQSLSREHWDNFISIVNYYIDSIQNIQFNANISIKLDDNQVNISDFINVVRKNRTSSIGIHCTTKREYQQIIANFLLYTIVNPYNNIIPIYINLHNKKVSDAESFLKLCVYKETKIQTDDVVSFMTRKYDSFNDLHIPCDVYLIFSETNNVQDEKSINNLIIYLEDNAIPFIMLFNQKTPLLDVFWHTYECSFLLEEANNESTDSQIEEQGDEF